ncbi:MAG: hypothetical protein WDN27_04230 [Candidatus Saccharibacteria bacterium]
MTQSNTNSTGAGTATSLTATFGSTPTQGDLLIAAAGGNSALTMSSSGWSLAASETLIQSAYIWYKIAGASESTSVQVSVGSADTIVLAIMEFSSSGGWPSSPLDKTATNSAGTPGASIGTGTTGTTTSANELAVALVNPHGWSLGAPASPTWSNSYTNVATVAGTTGATTSARVALFVATNTLSSTYRWPRAAASRLTFRV